MRKNGILSQLVLKMQNIPRIEVTVVFNEILNRYAIGTDSRNIKLTIRSVDIKNK